MAENHSTKSRMRTAQVDPSYDAYDEDPLVELARIVSEDGGYSTMPSRSVPETSPDPELDIGYDAELDIELDLENQLMEELELSMVSPDEGEPDGEHQQAIYSPEGPDDIEYTQEHVYAPEDSAALAQISRNAINLESEAVGDPAEFEPEFENDQSDEFESEDILSVDELSNLEQNLSFDGYQSDDDNGLAAEFPGLAAHDDDWADDLVVNENDDDGPPFMVPPVVPVSGEYAVRSIPGNGKSGRKVFAIAAVLSIAVLGGGVVAMMGSTSSNDVGAPPPVFKADVSPMKVAPDSTGEVASDEGSQAAFDVAVNPDEPVREELIDRNEKPVDRVIPLEEIQQTAVLRPVGDGNEKDVARISVDDSPAARAPKYEPIGPKTVTTLKVNADGRIIRSTLDENTVALSNDTAENTIIGGLPTSVKAPPSSAVPESEPAPVPVKVVDIKTGSNGGDAEQADRTSPLTDVITSLPANQPQSDQAATEPDPADPSAAASGFALPRARPAGAPTVTANAKPAATQLVAQPARTARAESAPVNLLEAARKAKPQQAAPVSTGAVTGSGFLVQLSSQRSEEQAVAAFNGLKKRFPSLLGNYEANIQRADLGDRGVYYRVRVGPMADQAGAQQFCGQLQSSGGSCFVTR